MSRRSRTLLTIGLVAVLALGLRLGSQEARANHLPADKIGVSASTVEVMQTQLVAGSSSQQVQLLSATVHSSAPADLQFQVTAECALWTDVTATATGSSSAKGNVKVWVEIDGAAVPVTLDSNGDGTPGDPDDGRVVFCNRDFQLDLTGLLPGQIIEIFNKTRTANAFNWMALNVGPGTHTISVKAQLEANVTGTGTAQAAVGKRALFVIPAKLANDATF